MVLSPELELKEVLRVDAEVWDVVGSEVERVDAEVWDVVLGSSLCAGMSSTGCCAGILVLVIEDVLDCRARGHGVDFS